MTQENSSSSKTSSSSYCVYFMLIFEILNRWMAKLNKNRTFPTFSTIFAVHLFIAFTVAVAVTAFFPPLSTFHAVCLARCPFVWTALFPSLVCHPLVWLESVFSYWFVLYIFDTLNTICSVCSPLGSPVFVGSRSTISSTFFVCINVHFMFMAALRFDYKPLHFSVFK